MIAIIPPCIPLAHHDDAKIEKSPFWGAADIFLFLEWTSLSWANKDVGVS